MSDLDKAIRDALVAWIENKAADYAAISESLWRDGKRTKAKWYGGTAGSLRADASNLRSGRTPLPVSSRETPPAPRPCTAKGVNHATREVVDCQFEDGHSGSHQQGESFWRAGAPEHVLAALRSEQSVPAPRPEPRVWRHGEHSDIDPEVQQVIGGRSGGLYTRASGKRFMWFGQKSSGVGIEYGVGSLLADEGHVTEVLSESISTDTGGADQ